VGDGDGFVFREVFGRLMTRGKKKGEVG